MHLHKTPNYRFEFNVSKAAAAPLVRKWMSLSLSFFAPCLPLTSLFHHFLYHSSLYQVEQFKQDPSPTTCLHSVFNVDTGDEVHSYSDYHHLQVSQRADKCRNEATVNRNDKNEYEFTYYAYTQWVCVCLLWICVLLAVHLSEMFRWKDHFCKC